MCSVLKPPRCSAARWSFTTRRGGQGALFTGFFSEEPGLGTEYYAYILPVNCAQPGADFSRQVGLCLVLCRTSSVLELLESADLDNSSLTLVYNGGQDQLRRAAPPCRWKEPS